MSWWLLAPKKRKKPEIELGEENYYDWIWHFFVKSLNGLDNLESGINYMSSNCTTILGQLILIISLNKEKKYIFFL